MKSRCSTASSASPTTGTHEPSAAGFRVFADAARITVPEHLSENCAKGPERSRWLDELPVTVQDLERRWSITTGEPFDASEGSCAWVAPATRANGSPVVLKIGLPHMEGADEIRGLRFWDGDPT